MRVSLDIDKVQPGVEELLGLTDFLMPTESFVQSFSDEKDWKKVDLKDKPLDGHIVGYYTKNPTLNK